MKTVSEIRNSSPMMMDFNPSQAKLINEILDLIEDLQQRLKKLETEQTKGGASA